MKPGVGYEQLPAAADKAAVCNAFTTQRNDEPAMMLMPMALLSLLESNEISSINMVDDIFANGEDFPSYFNEFAQSFEQGIDVGSINWDDILSGIDTSLI